MGTMGISKLYQKLSGFPLINTLKYYRCTALCIPSSNKYSVQPSLAAFGWEDEGGSEGWPN